MTHDLTPKNLDSVPTDLLSASRGPVSLLVVRIGVEGRSNVQLDPEDAHALIAPRERMASIAEAYGGLVGERWGDGLLALFGWPHHPEDHAQRACAAALHITDQLGTANQLSIADRMGTADPVASQNTAFRAEQVALSLRIGIHSAVGVHNARTPPNSPPSAQFALGGAAELAKQLAAIVPAGEVYLTRRCRRALCNSALLRCRPLSACKVDGAWQSIYALSAPPNPNVAAVRRSTQPATPPFCGRQSEFEWLRKRVESFARDQKGALVRVHGEPEIGKSRLLTRLTDEFGKAGNLRWIHVRGSACGVDASYQALREVLWSLLSPDAPDAHPNPYSDAPLGSQADALDWPTLSQAVEALLPLDATETARDLGFVLGVPHQGVKVVAEAMAPRIRTASARLMRAVTLARPLVVILDDVQWIDADSRAVLEQLPALATETPLLLIAGLRDPVISELETAILGSPGERVPPMDLHLVGLERHHAEAVLNASLPTGSSPKVLRERILDMAAGNPGFIRGAIEVLVDNGVLSKADGTTGPKVLDPDAPVTTPVRMRGAVLAAYCTLEDTQHHVLAVASVLGRRFGLKLLCALLHRDLHAAERLDLLAKLERDLAPLVESLYLEQWGYDENRDYEFRSPLIRDSVYGRLLRRQRNELHRCAAAILAEFAAPSDKALHSQILAHRAAVDDWAAATPYLPRGDDRTFETIVGQDMALTYDQAISAYRNLNTESLTQVQRAALERRLGELSVMDARMPASVEHFKRASRFLGLPVPETRIGTRKAIAGQVLVQLTHRWLPRVLIKPATSVAAELEREYLRVFDGQIWTLYFVDQERMILEAVRTLNRAESRGDREGMERGYLLLCFLTTAAGWSRQGERYAALGRRALLPDGQFLSSGFADDLLGIHHIMRGDLTQGIPHLHDAMRRARETGSYWILSSATACLSLAFEVSGNLAAALRAGKQLVVAGHAGALPILLHWGHGIQGGALLRSGRLKEAEEFLRSAVDLAGDMPDHEAQARFTGDLVCCLLRQNQTEAAQMLLDRTQADPRIARVQGMHATFLHHARLELRIAQAAKDGQSIDTQWHHVKHELRLAHLETKGYRTAETTVLRLEGTLHWLRAHPQQARACWDESIRLAESRGALFEAMLGNLEIAERTGDDDAEQAARELATGLALAVDWSSRR